MPPLSGEALRQGGIGVPSCATVALRCPPKRPREVNFIVSVPSRGRARLVRNPNRPPSNLLNETL